MAGVLRLVGLFDLVSVFWRGVVLSTDFDIFLLLLLLMLVLSSLGDFVEEGVVVLVSCRRSGCFLKGKSGLFPVDGVLLPDERDFECVLMLPRRLRYVVGDCELFFRRALVAGLT